jgi:hypothetical protein
MSPRHITTALPATLALMLGTWAGTAQADGNEAARQVTISGPVITLPAPTVRIHLPVPVVVWPAPRSQPHSYPVVVTTVPTVPAYSRGGYGSYGAYGSHGSYREPRRWDVDGDGIPNRYDPVYNPVWDRNGNGVPDRREYRHRPWGDRDHDGIPNRYDRRDDRYGPRDDRYDERRRPEWRGPH